MDSQQDRKAAIITGITGQDGAYLAELLLEKGYTVYGTYRRTSSVNVLAHRGARDRQAPELSTASSTTSLTQAPASACSRRARPPEVYNLAAQSFVAVSFDQPITTGKITGLGALNLLEAIRIVNPKIRFYQASTSEMFGKVQASPADRADAVLPAQPVRRRQALRALDDRQLPRVLRDLRRRSGILFNHESPLRGLEFVTRKITDGIAKIKLGKQEVLELGNLDAKRDWGYAKEYVEGMWRMLQAESPDTYVLATGRTADCARFRRRWPARRQRSTSPSRARGRTSTVSTSPPARPSCASTHASTARLRWTS